MKVMFCPVALECGGCPHMADEVEDQRATKAASVRSALTREGIAVPELEWSSAGTPLRYRNRLRLRVQPDGQVVFFNEHKNAGCVVLEPELERYIAEIRRFAGRRPDVLRPFAHLEVRAPDLDGRRGICVYPQLGAEQGKASALAQLTALGDAVAVSTDPPDRIACQRWSLASDVYAFIPLDAFMQVNTSVNQSLILALRDLGRKHEIGSFCDLFAGSGNLGLCLLKDGMRGLVAERQPSAVHAFRESCRAQGLDRATSVLGSAEPVAEAWHRENSRVELLIVDAPRAGVKRGLDSMAALAERFVAVCSCNPDTLARDLRVLGKAGFLLRSVLLFDMFPQTRHVEVLAWLERV